MPETAIDDAGASQAIGPDDGCAHATQMQVARDAATSLAAAWAADPKAAAAVVRYRAAQRIAEDMAPDSCAVLENMKRSYAAYADRQAADPEAVCAFEQAEEAYASALRALEATV